KLLTRIASMTPSAAYQYTLEGESDAVVNHMAAVSGLWANEIINPFRDSKSFESDVAKLTYGPYGQAEMDRLVNYIQNELPTYISESGTTVPNPALAAQTSTVTIQASPAAPTQPGSSCVKIARSLSKGMNGIDVKALQLFLISKGYLA